MDKGTDDSQVFLTWAWRMEHLRNGDDALRLAHVNLKKLATEQPVEIVAAGAAACLALATMAQAHYAAAAVRFEGAES